MTTFALTCNCADVIVSLQAKRAAIKAEVDAASSTIVTNIKGDLVQLYSSKLAALWVLSSTPASGAILAFIQVGTTDFRVIGYEFGTKAHEEVPVNAPFLQFEGTNAFAGQSIVTDHVFNPGERAHNRRGTLLALLRADSITQWTAAIKTALATT